MSRAVPMPRYVDEMPVILLWSVDEFIPFMVFVMIGFIMGQVLLFCIFGWIFKHYCNKYTKFMISGYLNHMLYWYGFGFVRGRSIPNPFLRELY